MSWLKKLFNRKTLALWVVVILAGAWVVRSRTSHIVQPQLVAVTRGTITETVSLSGNVTPATQANIFPSASGTVENVAVNNGDSVISGDRLFDVKTADTAKKSLSINAPIAGTVANLKIANGNQVVASAGSVTGASSPALIIGDFSNYNISIPVNEVDLAKVAINQKASITFDAISDKSFEGTVTQIDTVGTNTQGVVTYDVTVHIDNPDAAIKAGMTATVAIETNKRDNVLVVPNTAIKPYKGGKAVLVLDTAAKQPNQQKYQTVTIGLKGATETEIIDGVTEGTNVIVNASTTPTTGGFFGGN